LGDGRLPAQATGDHQVQYEEEIAVELAYDPLPDPAKALHTASVGGRQGRVYGAHEERTTEAHALEHGSGQMPLEAFDVDSNLGKLGHGPKLPRSNVPCRETFLARDPPHSTH
jgi:hypothetical protein